MAHVKSVADRAKRSVMSAATDVEMARATSVGMTSVTAAETARVASSAMTGHVGRKMAGAMATVPAVMATTDREPKVDRAALADRVPRVDLAGNVAGISRCHRRCHQHRLPTWALSPSPRHPCSARNWA